MKWSDGMGHLSCVRGTAAVSRLGECVIAACAGVRWVVANRTSSYTDFIRIGLGCLIHIPPLELLTVADTVSHV